MQTKKNQKNAERKRLATRQLIGIEGLTDYSLKTGFNTELVFFSVAPSNISVLSESNLSAKIYSLMTVLKGLTEIEILCLNSRESFESNKNFIKKRINEESNHAVRKLLEMDSTYLDHIQAQTATAREFLLVVRIRNLKEKEIFSHLNRIEKIVLENGFTVSRFGRDEIKTMLAVYYEQNTTNEKFEAYDGERAESLRRQFETAKTERTGSPHRSLFGTEV